uniref:soluble scavenger receptor cysteine-rich domain-containing protein SSC5D isoform X2 n=1 Tax=Ictidomys tridecemlineatus TaxID=43179 RepID=UPI001A9FB0EC|nr:soluble scavenger receptor cysteine-rich domain-containing protein SSC5D isoform X2 [Ictidomys tridecemlineatus]
MAGQERRQEGVPPPLQSSRHRSPVPSLSLPNPKHLSTGCAGEPAWSPPCGCLQLDALPLPPASPFSPRLSWACPLPLLSPAASLQPLCSWQSLQPARSSAGPGSLCAPLPPLLPSSPPALFPFTPSPALDSANMKVLACLLAALVGIQAVGQRVATSRDDSASPPDGGLWPGLSGGLSPGTEEPPVTQVPRPAGIPQNGPRKKSLRPPKPAKSTRAPLLTGAPRQERLRLVSGPHGCAGRLEVWHGGRWGTVCDDGWDLRDAAVACRELGCGGALAAPGGSRFGPGAGPVWMDDVGCGGGEQALRDCPRSPWGRSNCDHSEDAGLVCTGPAPRLRLADGPHGCAGRLEVWHGGRWGSVCDDAWDLRDAAVACRELGCGGALAAPGGAFFGEGTGPITLDDLRCRGNETALRFCPARPWGQHDCHHREDAGAVCDGMPLGLGSATAPAVDSNSSAPREVATRPLSTTVGQTLGTASGSPPPASPTAPWEPGPEAGSPGLRLVAGPSRCSGRLEVWHDGRWGTVCDDSWDTRDSAVVCRELGCGGPRQPDPAGGRFGWGAGPIWLDDVSCAGTESSLSDCPAAPWGKHNCAHNEDVGVACTGTPGLDTISDPFSWSWLPGPGRGQDAWLPGELVTKPSASLTSSVPEKTTKAPGKVPKSTKKWVTKIPKRPTTQPSGMTSTKPSRGLSTPTPRELTAQTTILTTEASPRRTSEPKRLISEDPHRLTSHTTAALTPQVPRERTSKTVAMLSTQSPRDTTSEATAGQIPQASPETSAEIPEGSPEPSKDSVPSPTASTLGEPGPFRVRLADGPNRCAGRLEVWHAGRWGTVCDDSWDLRDGTVACWELGCGKVRPRVGKTHYGPGTGPIWLDDMGCKGTETSLSDCPSGLWGKHNCDHEEDVGLTCTGYTDDDDYPPWTWDPTSGEDLATETTTAVGSERTRPWGPSPATRRLPDTGDQDGDKSSWTWDTPSRRDLAKGTPTAATAGPTLTTGTTKSPGQPSPAPRAAGDRGSPRKPPWSGRRLSQPTAARTAAPTPSHAPSPSPGPSGPLILDWAAPWEVTSDPADTPPPTPTLPPLTTADLAPSTADSSVVPAVTPELSSMPSSTSPQEPTSGPQPSGLTPESVTAPNMETASYPKTAPEPPGSSDPSTSPGPTGTTHPTTHPTTSLHPTTVPPPPMTLDLTMTPPPSTASPPTVKAEPAVTIHPSRTPDPISTPALSTRSLPASLGTELPSPTLAPKDKPSLHPQLTSVGTPHTPTLQVLSLDPSPAPGSSRSRASPAPSVDPLSTEGFKPPRSQTPRLTPPPAHTPHSASDPTVAPDLHLPPRARPLDQPPPDPLVPGPAPGQIPGPLGPCLSPAPPVRVMACEPPALVELVDAVRAVGDQLQRLTQVLEQDRQERRALELGLAQLAEAAQGLGHLGEAVKRLAEVAWPPSTPVPTTTTPEEEERPLRGDV